VTEVDFFFDPSCPWTWVTSRWLATVAPERDLAVTWRTWSLAIKNEGQEFPAHLPAELRERILAGRAFSQGALRVLEAARQSGGDDAVGRLYTELGRRAHGPDGGYPEGLIAEAVAAAGLASDLVGAADEERWDRSIRDNMAEVGRAIGDDVGVPIVATRRDGALLAMAGPIMSDVPPLPRALALWDAVATVVGEPSVFELKRHRTGGPTPPPLGSDGRIIATGGSVA
jgi:2-hydroxychromene-2-carboxylate isomerase